MSRSVVSLAVLSLALLASAPAFADPPEDGRRGGRGEWRGGEDRGSRDEARGGWDRGRGDGQNDGGDRGRRFEGGGAPPVTANEPGRGQRSWADRPRVEAPRAPDAPRAPEQGFTPRNDGDRYGLAGGHNQGGNAGGGARWRGEHAPGGERWTDRGRGRGNDDHRGRDHAGPRDGGRNDGWRGDEGHGRDDWRGNDGRDRNAWRGNDGRNHDGWRGDDGRRHNEWRDDGGRRYAGNDDHRWRGRPGYGRELRSRDHGRHWYEPQRYHQHYRAHVRYRAPHYVYPHGWHVRSWRFGEYLPHGWYGARYYLDWRAYDLPYPPIGCEWVRVGRDAILVDVWTGEILSVWYDLFW